MKKLFLIAALCTASVCNIFAGKIITDSIKSQVLGATVKYNVYLPNDDRATALPVVYLLHGLHGNNNDWRDTGRMQEVADELIESGEALPMIIIMPCAGGNDVHKIWNGYFNMPGWNYEDFFFTELMPQAEKKYNANSDKQHRAIMGLSMGGGGSVVYSQRHHDMFSSCYAMSAWLDEKVDNQKEVDMTDKLSILRKAVSDKSALRYVENADDTAVQQMRTVKWFIDCGDDDFLFDVNVRMHQLLRDKKIKSELRIRNGVHNWEYWHLALRNALPFASRNFSR